MMEILIRHAERIAQAAQGKRLEQIAAAIRECGVAVEMDAQSVIARGRRLARTWLADPLLRFAGRYGR